MQQAERRLRGERERQRPCLSLSLSAPVLLALTPRTSALRKGTYAPLSMWSALATCPTPLPRPVLLACSAGCGTRQGTDPDGAPHFAVNRMPIGKPSLLTRLVSGLRRTKLTSHCQFSILPSSFEGNGPYHSVTKPKGSTPSRAVLQGAAVASSRDTSRCCGRVAVVQLLARDAARGASIAGSAAS